MRRLPTASLLLIFACAALAPALPVAAQAPDLAVLAGGFNVGDDRIAHTADLELGVEVRFVEADLGFLREGLRPIAGATATSGEGYWAFVGLRYEHRLRERWTLGLSIAVALYERGDGKNLGGAVEFRSGIEAAYRVSERLRVGVMLYHLSNAGLYHPNPGTESLVLTVSTPLGR